MTRGYDPETYWSQLHKRGDMSSVGQSGLPSEMNDWFYRIQRRNLLQFLRRNGVERIIGDAYDIGAGRGYWVQEWLAAGAARVDGCDLVEEVVSALNARFGPGGHFEAVDIGRAGALPADRYSFVSCMNVLLHLTDDARFDNALVNLAGMLRPGGRLLLAEPILLNPSFERPFSERASSRARPLARYRDGLVQAGLDLVDLAPATAIANNPIESRTRIGFLAWRAAWAGIGLPAKLSPRGARVVGRFVEHVDPLLLRLGAAPSGKYALFEKPVQPRASVR